MCVYYTDKSIRRHRYTQYSLNHRVNHWRAATQHTHARRHAPMDRQSHIQLNKTESMNTAHTNTHTDTIPHSGATLRCPCDAAYHLEMKYFNLINNLCTAINNTHTSIDKRNKNNNTTTTTTTTSTTPVELSCCRTTIAAHRFGLFAPVGRTRTTKESRAIVCHLFAASIRLVLIAWRWCLGRGGVLHCVVLLFGSAVAPADHKQ